mgnify:CR=1 FL=1
MFENLKLIMQVIPYILTLIKTVEQSIPEGGSGKAKLTFVRETIAAIYPQIMDLWPIIEKIISYAVTLYNTTGVFQKK